MRRSTCTSGSRTCTAAQLLDQNYGINPEPNLSDDRFKGGQSAIALANWASFADFQTNLWQIDPNAVVAVMDPISDTAGTRMVFPIDRGFYVAACTTTPRGSSPSSSGR